MHICESKLPTNIENPVVARGYTRNAILSATFHLPHHLNSTYECDLQHSGHVRMINVAGDEASFLDIATHTII